MWKIVLDGLGEWARSIHFPLMPENIIFGWKVEIVRVFPSCACVCVCKLCVCASVCASVCVCVCGRGGGGMKVYQLSYIQIVVISSIIVIKNNQLQCLLELMVNLFRLHRLEFIICWLKTWCTLKIHDISPFWMELCMLLWLDIKVLMQNLTEDFVLIHSAYYCSLLCISLIIYYTCTSDWRMPWLNKWPLPNWGFSA